MAVGQALNGKIRVFIADDHVLVRDGLRELIERKPEFAVVGESGNGNEVLAIAAKESWDVLLLDLSLPGMSGIDLVKQVRQRQPKLKTLVLTMRPEDGYAVRLVRAGIDGYVTKGSSSQVLIAALRSVAEGKKYFSEEMQSLMLDDFHQTEEAPHHQFSPREMDIFRFYVGGLTTNAIARKMNIDASTVSTHLKHMRIKLGVGDNRQILSYAATLGLLSADLAEQT